ncbi:CAP domain-containing protein [Lactiplantibacillus plantarum]|uniref:CAP domain-containing protein n=1 Tax=Lactiplantibacillus plantarum TaxID=1590 RepID=UPI00159159C8|nr:CAP domain-containing protein [Lactiplantibacillus plantarum]QKX10431.1 Chromosome partition protein Smc [Lactiplantibacillus plantarum]
MNKKLLYTSITTAALFVGTQLGVNNAQADTATDNSDTTNQTSATQGSAQTATNEKLATVKPTSQQQYQANVQTAKGNVATAQNQVNTTQTKVATAQGQVTNQSQLVAIGQSQYDAGKAQVDRAQQTLDANNQVLAEAENKVDAAKSQTAAAETQIPADQQQIAANKVAIANQPATEKKAQTAKDAAVTALTQAKTEQATAQSDADAASAVTAAKQATVDQASAAQQKAATQANQAKVAVASAQDAVNKNTQAINSAKTAIQNTTSQINANNQAVSTAQAKVTAAQAALAAAERPTTTTESQNKYDAAEFPQSQLTGAETVSVAYPSNGKYVPNADKINQYMFEYINQLRALNGQPVLKQTSTLQNNAIARAAAQVDGGLDHTGSSYAENLTQVYPQWFMSDQETAYNAVMGWYDESNNVESGSFGHRVNLIYSTGDAGVAINLAKHVAAFEVDNAGMTEAQQDKYVDLFDNAHTNAATGTKALPAVTFNYVQTTPADPKKIAAANATLIAATASLNGLQNTGKTLATTLANQNASLQALQNQTSGLQATVTTKQAQVQVAATSLKAANVALTQAQGQLATAQQQQLSPVRNLKTSIAKTAAAQVTATQAAKNLASTKTLIADLTAENARLAAVLAQGQAQVDTANEQLAAGKAQLDRKKTDLAQFKQVLGAARVDLAVAQGDLTATKAFLARVEANKFTTTTAAAADGIAETTNVDQSTGVTAPHATATKTVANSNGTINATSTSVDVSDGDVTTKLVAGAKQQPVAAQATALPQTDEKQSASLTVVGLLAAGFSLLGLTKLRKRA